MSDERYRQPGPATVSATAVAAAPPDLVYAALATWHRQGEWIPLTTVRVVSGDGGPGSTIEAVTGLRTPRGSRSGMRDVMRVTAAEPPHELRVVHCGWPLRGPGVFRCVPLPGGRTRVEWHEWLHPPAGALGRLGWRAVRPGVAWGFRIALRRLATLVERGQLP